MMEFAYRSSREGDFAEFSEHYAVPLIRTKNIQLIPDGGQFERSEKTAQMSDWDVAQNYLNACSANRVQYDTYDMHLNCSHCGKCIYTIMPLDALGKLDSFAKVFDIERYRKEAMTDKCMLVIDKDLDGLQRDNYDFCKAHGMKLPSVAFALMYLIFRKPQKVARYIMQKLLPEKVFRRIHLNHLYKRLKKNKR